LVSKGSAPKAEDPRVVAAAQTQSNKETATANAALNRVDQYTPYGSSTYQITGNNPDGTPNYRQDINLSPDQQQLLDTTTAGQKSLGNTALGMLNQVQGSYANPIDVSSINSLNGGTYADEMKQAQDAAYAKNAQYLDPQFEQGGKALDNRLINQGITQGSEAYNNAQGEFGRTKQKAYDDARNSAIAQGNAQQNQLFNQDSTRLQQLFALRNQPLNEYGALMNGTQVTNPNFTAVPNANQANTDVAGINANSFNQQMQAYNAKQQGINNLFSLGGSLGSAAILASDRRLKRDIQHVGFTPSGIPTYTFRYNNNDDETYFGVMADECRHIPGAVLTGPDGFDMVDYSRVI
jgi:hypothetical protein